MDWERDGSDWNNYNKSAVMNLPVDGLQRN